MLQDKHWLARN